MELNKWRKLQHKSPLYLLLHSITVDISAMILDDVNACPITSVPNADAGVPAAGH